MRRYQKGQTLIESLVALTLIMAVLTSIATIVINSLYNSQFVKEQNIANKYSEQGMEDMRSLQASSLKDFEGLTAGGPQTYCFDWANSPPWTTCTTSSLIPGTNYNRTIYVERGTSPPPPPVGNGCSSNETKVVVTTRWNSSKCTGGARCHKSEVSSCLVHDKGITP